MTDEAVEKDQVEETALEARPRYITRRPGVEAAVPSANGVRQERHGFIARLRFGREITDHQLQQMREGHVAAETASTAEAAAVTLLRTGQLRLQVAHRAGEFVKECGPDSAAFEVAPDVAQHTFDKTERALSEIEDVGMDNLKRNLRRI